IRACLRWVAGSRPPNKLQARGHSTESEGWMEGKGLVMDMCAKVLRNDVDEVEDMRSPPEREQMSHASRTALRAAFPSPAFCVSSAASSSSPRSSPNPK
ncbi:hypothetical protein KUCAC02_025628, partial [Chaenocephalus aceratus]